MPYTKALLDAIPRLERPPHTPLPVVAGRPPDLSALPAGCPFAPRCPTRRRTLPRDRAAAGRGHARPPLGVLASRARTSHPRPQWRRARSRHEGRPGGPERQRRRAAAAGAQPRAGVRGPRPRRREGRRRARGLRTCRSTCAPGETLGIVGETGSGKSTLARSVLQAPRPKAGSVSFRGTDLVGLKGRRLLQARRTCRWSSRTRSARSTRSGGCSTSSRNRWSPTASAPAGAPAAGRRGARARRARPDVLRQAPPPRAVRRPGPAGRHRPGARARPRADHLRRAGVVARRPHPGPGPQPVRAAAGRARPVLPVHRPRPRPGQAGQRPGGGDVPGQAVRGRAGARRSTASRCTRTRWRCSTRSPAPTDAPNAAHDSDPRRAAVAGRPAERLPVPHPLPAGRRSAARTRSRSCASCHRAHAGHSVACHFPVERNGAGAP